MSNTLQVLTLIDKESEGKSIFVLDRPIDDATLAEIEQVLSEYRDESTFTGLNMMKAAGKVREIVERRGYKVNSYYHKAIVF